MNRHFTNRFNKALTKRREQLHEAEGNLSNFWEAAAKCLVEPEAIEFGLDEADQRRLEALISRRDCLNAQVSELVGVLGMMNNRAAA
jgi:hypothetical protein